MVFDVGLLDFLVNGYLFEDSVILLQFQTLGSVLLVLGSDVTGGARHTAVLVLGALHDYLYPVAFLSHFDFELKFECAKVIIPEGFYKRIMNYLSESKRLGSAISFSMSATCLGSLIDILTGSLSVIRISSSIRTPIPRNSSGNNVSSG